MVYMTQWMQLVHAAWDRFDAWRARRDAVFDADPQVVEIRRINREFGGWVEDPDPRAIWRRDAIGRPRNPDRVKARPHVPAKKSKRLGGAL
jgi:hypothetical protein